MHIIQNMHDALIKRIEQLKAQIETLLEELDQDQDYHVAAHLKRERLSHLLLEKKELESSMRVFDKQAQ